MDRVALTQHLKQYAGQLGFDIAGVCAAVTPHGITHLHDWLAAGYAGEMQYIDNRAPAYADPSKVLEGVRSLLVLAMNYRTDDPLPVLAGEGRVSRYAWGHDYHQVIHARLAKLVSELLHIVPAANVRGVVDTAPLLEREFAHMAGLGWIGKNTLLLNRSLGSWFFLAALLTDVELAYDQPHDTDHCGTCTACLDACPTQAFVAPYVLDSRRCISYLNIELRGAIPADLRSGMGDWLFGCDVCQEVCPWNRRAPESQEEAFLPSHHPLAIDSLFFLTDEDFRNRFRHTPLWRAKRRGILRNAAIVLGNQRATKSLAALVHGLQDDEPLVRGACAWALGQMRDRGVAQRLKERQSKETDESVLGEIEAALQASAAQSIGICGSSSDDG